MTVKGSKTTWVRMNTKEHLNQFDVVGSISNYIKKKNFQPLLKTEGQSFYERMEVPSVSLQMLTPPAMNVQERLGNIWHNGK